MAIYTIFRIVFFAITTPLLLLAIPYLLFLDSTNPISVQTATALCVKASSKLARDSFSASLAKQIQLWATAESSTPASTRMQFLIGIMEPYLIPSGLFFAAFNGSLAAFLDTDTAIFITVTIAFLVILGLYTLIGSLASFVVNLVI